MADLKKLSYKDPTTGLEVPFYPITGVLGIDGLEERLAALLVDTVLKGVPTAPTPAAGTNTDQLATTAYVDNTIANAISSITNGLFIRGTIGVGGTITEIPAAGNYEPGDMYVVISDGSYAGKECSAGVISDGSYAGKECSAGDYLVCISANGDDDWVRIEASLNRYVTGPAASVDNNIAVFDGITGTFIKDSGVSFASLGYEHPDSGVEPGTYDRVTVDAKGHVTGGVVLAKAYDERFAEWILTEKVDAGGILTLPISFTVGKEKLVLICNGVTLTEDNYSYTGEVDDIVNEVTALFPLKAGYEFNASVVSL